MGLVSTLVANLRLIVPVSGQANSTPRRGRSKGTRPALWRKTLRCEELEMRCLLDCNPNVHADNPVMQAEHLAVCNLVKDADVTNTAVQNGTWSDPATWQDGQVPAANANVLIPTGLTVTVDDVRTEALRTIRVDGALQFDPTLDTRLLVDTIVVTPAGNLVMGTATNPIAPGHTATITFADRGPIDTTWDPRLFSRGLISHGTVSMYGEAKTSYVTLAQSALAGQNAIKVTPAPTNWHPNDRIIVTGTSAVYNRDEDLRIEAITGQWIVLDRSLEYNHEIPGGLGVYVADLTRNVVLESQNAEPIGERGHVMFMHKPTVDVNYAAFNNLGRTDKKVVVNDPVLDSSGALVPGTGTNPRGRYAVHFHRTGIDNTTPSATIRGSVVAGSPGWGFVNHSGNVTMDNNVSYNVVGAGFVTEAGDEIGTFNRNLAIRSVGSGAGLTSRQDQQDFGHQGDGFWFQGGGIEVTNNIAVGQRHAGFIFFTRGLIQAGLGTTRFLAANLADPTLAGGESTIDVGNVPIRRFDGNVAYASGDGLETWFHLQNAQPSARSVIENFKVWNTRGSHGVNIPYTNQTTLRNVSVRGNLYHPTGTGIDRNDATKNINYENVRVEGWTTGIPVPVRGANVIQGGYLNNVRSIVIVSAEAPRTVDITGPVQFGTLSATALGTNQQYDIYLKADLTPDYNDLTAFFLKDIIRLDYGSHLNQQVYYTEQGSDYVLFPSASAPPYVPPELLNQTNQQLFDQYGLALAGAPAPASTTTDARINGLIGSRATYLVDLTLKSRKYTNNLTDYQLKYTVGTNPTVVYDPVRQNLREGWNLITRTIDAHVRTFLVFGDITPPTFSQNAEQAARMTIPQSQLGNGFTVTGTVDDNSTGDSSFMKTFDGATLQALPIQTRADGSRYVLLTFTIKDRAGNATDVQLQLNMV